MVGSEHAERGASARASASGSAGLDYARPFEDPGLTLRIAPFVVATVLAFAVIPFVADQNSGVELILAGAMIPMLVAAAYLVPWGRLGAGWQVLPPLLFLVVVVLIRDGTGGHNSVFTPLLILPVAWFAFHGTRLQVAVSVACLGLAIALPVAIDPGSKYPLVELARAVLVSLIAGALAVAGSQLVRTNRDRQVLASSIIESAHESFISIDEEGLIVEWNPRAERDFGWSREEAIGRQLADMIVPERHREHHLEGLRRYLETGDSRILGRRIEITALRRDGSEFPVELSISAVQTSGSVRFNAFLHDITDRKEAEVRLTHRASHDPLTGLPNRTLFEDRMVLALGRLRRDSHPHAVLFLDLDRFKVVNDTRGHDAGDQLLVAVAKRLSHLVRPNDTVSRLGGDEFAILCDRMDENGAELLAERIEEVLVDPIGIGGREIPITASIGVAVNRDPGVSPSDVLADADLAMYEAKEQGRARFAFFDPEMRERAQSRLALEAGLGV